MFKELFSIWSNSRKDLIFLCLICFCLVQNNYFSESEWVHNAIGYNPINGLKLIFGNAADTRFLELFYWVMVINFHYLLLPIVFLRISGLSLKDHGLNFKIEKGAVQLFLLALLFMLPLVIYFSGTDSFQNRYPFYETPSHKLNSWQIAWELLYVSQFFALEFFFRGFIVHYLKSKIGIYSIIAMTIPYCMIHFGKPYPETIGAVVAGLVLGTFSYKSGSIWLGFFLHIAVALSMDALAFFN